MKRFIVTTGIALVLPSLAFGGHAYAGGLQRAPQLTRAQITSLVTPKSEVQNLKPGQYEYL